MGYCSYGQLIPGHVKEMNYLISWLHLYTIHTGAWISACFICELTKHGIPRKWQVGSLLSSAIRVSLILALFSSHAHNHYLATLGK